MWEFYYYGITGQKLVTVSCPLDMTTMYPMAPNCTIVGENVYFGRRQLVSDGLTVVTDRLGSVRGNSNGERFTYYPYGEERTSTVDGRDKFGTLLPGLGGAGLRGPAILRVWDGAVLDGGPGRHGVGGPMGSDHLESLPICRR